jgi:hypothetical protein
MEIQPFSEAPVHPYYGRPFTETEPAAINQIITSPKPPVKDAPPAPPFPADPVQVGLPPMLWAAKECGAADFGDARLSQRLVSLVTSLAEHPEQSIPEALGKWSDVKAAYRFFDNEKVSVDAIYDGHLAPTLEKIKDQPVILAVQDTTCFNFTLHKDTEGLGPIGKGDLAGFFLHTCLAVSTAGVPLGVLAHRLWARPPKIAEKAKNQLLKDKESARWIEVTREVAQVVPAPTRVIMIGDRESDIYDLLLLADEKRDFLIRARFDRQLDNSNDRLWQTVENAPALGQTTIKVPRADKRPEREATLTLRSATVTLRPPANRKKEELPTITVGALLVREEAPPAGAKPVEWLLLTTLPCDTLQDALQVLTWYTYRWRIERYHFILKSGCRVEKLELETGDRLMCALAVYSMVAVRLLHLTYQVRETPDMPCTVSLGDSEWKALYAATFKTKEVPESPPDLETAVLWIAKLGGFLARKGDGKPGVKVVWRGFRRLEAMTVMWEIFNSP